MEISIKAISIIWRAWQAGRHQVNEGMKKRNLNTKLL